MLAFNIEKALLGQSLKHGRCEMMSDGGEATDSIHADWKGSLESRVSVSLKEISLVKLNSSRTWVLYFTEMCTYITTVVYFF